MNIYTLCVNIINAHYVLLKFIYKIIDKLILKKIE